MDVGFSDTARKWAFTKQRRSRFHTSKRTWWRSRATLGRRRSSDLFYSTPVLWCCI